MRFRRRCELALLALVCIASSAHAFAPLLDDRLLIGRISSTYCPSTYYAAAVTSAERQQPQHHSVETTNEFISHVITSVNDGTFVSFILRGPKAPRKRKKKGGGSDTDFDAIDKEKERLRGCIKSVQGRLISLESKKKRGTKTQQSEEHIYLQATTKFHGATDFAQNILISERGAIESGLSKIFFPDASDGAASEWGSAMLSHPELGIRTAELVTTAGTFDLNLTLKKPKIRFTKNGKDNKESEGRTEIASHDRSKNVPLSPSEPFLTRLGVSNDKGRPKQGMASKLRQCQKFCEIVGNLVETSMAAQSKKQLVSIRSADMGCGRGYLTFSLHSYLTKKYGEKYDVKSRGIEVRPKLVAETNVIAQELGIDFNGLRFAEGTIESVALSGNNSDSGEGDEFSNLNILIALHACDTATDDALWSGIREGADVIVTAPCCHKEVRRQLDPFFAESKDHVLADVLRHGIYRERVAETVTDSIRALLLEIAGYSVSVFEFIGGEHTSKNVMITGTKLRQQRSKSEIETLHKRLVALASLHGVKKQRLAEWMGESVDGLQTETHLRKGKISSKRMPSHSVNVFEE